MPLRSSSSRLSSLVLAAAGGALLLACATAAPESDSALGTVRQAGAGQHARYIVKFKNPAAKGIVQAAGGSVVLDLPAHGAFAARIPAAAVAGLSNNPNIEYIEEDPIRKPSALAETIPYGVTAVQAPQIWDAKDGVVDAYANMGGGKKICIIDSGLDTSHPDFAGMTITKTDDPNTGNAFIDTCHHGTHVAGTIAGQSNDYGVTGVAPGVSLHIVKVFGDDTGDYGCAWIYSSSLVAALTACEDAGAHIVSMSLGGDARSAFEQSAFDAAYKRGVLSIAAAGNDGPDSQIPPSYPASYGSVISVAAVDEARQVATFSQQNAYVELAAPGVHVLSSVPVGEGHAASATVDGSNLVVENMAHSPLGEASGPLVNCGLGDAPCPGGGGQVCLIQRGTYTFESKIENCIAGGGTAAIIYNNVAGIFGGDAGHATGIPSVSTSDNDGAALMATKLGKTATVSVTPADHAYYDGTSMATPHVSAVAALVWRAHPEWTNVNVRTALQKTAKDLGPVGRDKAYGYGLVQAAGAIAHVFPALPAVCTALPPGSPCTSAAQCCSNKCNKTTKKCN
jgi:serine protease